jgi:hypothetical protein
VPGSLHFLQSEQTLDIVKLVLQILPERYRFLFSTLSHLEIMLEQKRPICSQCHKEENTGSSGPIWKMADNVTIEIVYNQTQAFTVTSFQE